jgi:acetyltransferase-like isoleucine patch superfamily enzyme
MSLKSSLGAASRRVIAVAVHRVWEWLRTHAEISPSTPAGRRFAYLGEGACIGFPTGAIYGEPWIRVGDHTLIGVHVTLSAGFVPGLDLGPDPIVTIGRACSIGRGSHIVGHQSIEIGDDVFTGPYVYITDQNHGYEDPGTPIGLQLPVNRPVSIGAGSWLGAGSIILPGASIGRNVVVAAGSVVRGAIPDRCVAAGVPARVVREHTADGWRPSAGPVPDPLVPPEEKRSWT